MAVSQYGVSVSGDQMQSMANLVGKVMTCNVGALTRYGVTHNDTQKKMLQNGIEARRTAMLVEVLGQKFGGLLEDMANTPEGKFVQIKNAWADDNMPDRAKPTVTKLMRKDYLKGDDGDKLNHDGNILRILVINDRAGIYGEERYIYYGLWEFFLAGLFLLHKGAETHLISPYIEGGFAMMPE